MSTHGIRPGTPRERTGGEIVVDLLQAAGVEVVFGVLSVHNLPIYDALTRDGSIRVVAARSEQGAVGMADGYARATGRLGVALTSTGVGAANAAGPLLEAYVASSPVLHLTGQIDSRHVDQGDRGALHAGKDQLAMLQAVGKAALRAASTEVLAEQTARAMQVALSGRPGPVSLEIPIDQQYRKVPAPEPTFTRPVRAEPAPDALARAGELLAEAKRPLLWAGGGVIAAGASAALTRLAEALGAGVITTAAGRGAIPEDHPLCIGNFSMEEALAELYERSDVLLAVGTRFRGNETRTWQLPLPARLVQVDAAPEMIGCNYPVEVGIVGDAKLTLEALERTLGRRVDGGPDPGWLAAVGEARAAVRERWRSTLGPYERIMDDLRAALPRDAVVVRDVTVPATAWGSRLLEVYEPRTAIHSASLAIGQGLPMAIGAAIGQPERTVVLLAGDGGFAITLGELPTAVQEGLSLVTVLFNDAGYGILRNLQDAHFEGRHFGVDLYAPDFVRLGESVGAWASQVASVPELGPALREALLVRGRPSLIEVDQRSLGPMAVPFTGAARLVP